MEIQDQIRSEMPRLLDLCQRLGISALRARVEANTWTSVTFIGDVDTARLEGYADRFFGLEEGLTYIFHRRVRLLDEETERKQRLRDRFAVAAGAAEIELMRAS